MKKFDGRKNARVKKGHIFKMEHLDAPYLEFFLKKVFGDDSILNGCCGYSQLGNKLNVEEKKVDCRYDWSKDSNRNIAANLFQQSKFFNENQYDFYYIDPPDAYYNPFSKEIIKYYLKGKDKRGRSFGDPYQWQYEALDICSKALVLQRPLIMTNWPALRVKEVEYFLIRDSRPMGRVLEIIWKK